MSVDTYKGDSPSKKIARAFYWSRVSVVMGQQAFCSSKHLFLASREGADIGVLSVLGVPFENMVPVEIVESAASECQRRWPQVCVRCGNAFEIAEQIAHELGSTMFDVCGPPSAALANGCWKVFRKMRVGSILGFAVQRGHDKNIALKLFGRKALQKENDASSRFGLDFHGVTVDGTRGPRIDVSRARAIQEFLMRRGRICRAFPVMRTLVNYQSRTCDSNGVPMSMCAFEVLKGSGLTDEEFVAACVTAEKDACDCDAAVHVIDDDLSTWVACLSDWDADRLALLMNVSKGTVAAWRAHETRGTYAVG